MGGVGSGNWRGKESQPSDERIEAARLELSRLVARAHREGQAACGCPTETLRLVLYGIVSVNAEIRALIHDLERSMDRENECYALLKSAFDCGRQTAIAGGGASKAWAAFQSAQGIEAASAAETVEHGSVHESPVGNADAPKGDHHAPCKR